MDDRLAHFQATLSEIFIAAELADLTVGVITADGVSHMGPVTRRPPVAAADRPRDSHVVRIGEREIPVVEIVSCMLHAPE